MSASRVLVTGAGGLIGSAVTRLLLRRGHTVIGCDDFSIGTWRDHDERLVWEVVDVAAPDAVPRLSRHAPEMVIHCAAHPGGRSNEEPAADVRVNAFGTMQIFEWCARTQLPVVYLSSSAVYGDQPSTPISESAPLHPGTVYAVCKVAGEQFLRVLGAAYGLQWTVLRLFATYGPGHRPGTAQGIVNVMLTQMLTNSRVVVRGSLDRVRDLMYVDDAADVIVQCLFDPRVRGQVLNAGTGQGTTVGEVITRLWQALGKPASDLSVDELSGTPGDPLYSVADIGALQAQTGFIPRVGLGEGLARLVEARVRH